MQLFSFYFICKFRVHFQEFSSKEKYSFYKEKFFNYIPYIFLSRNNGNMNGDFLKKEKTQWNLKYIDKNCEFLRCLMHCTSMF